MFIKKYRAKDMSEAMGKIRRDLGPDALIVSSRQVRDKGIRGMFTKKKFEVVAAYEPMMNKSAGAMQESTAAQKKSAPLPDKTDRIDALGEKLDDLAYVVRDLASRQGKRIDFRSAKLKRQYKRFVEQDVWEDIAKDVLMQAQQICQVSKERSDTVVENLLIQKLERSAPIQLQNDKQNVIVVMGPTGVGKTTTLVKLAGKYLLEEGRSVGIINTDTYRIAAQQQLRTYADIMDIPMHTVYKTDEMDDAMKRLKDKQVILIDTAGKNSHDEQYRDELRQIIERSGANEVLLLISASTGYRCAKQIVDNYASVGSYKLVVTKTDEVSTVGGILNIATIANRPVAYLTTGQNVPDDIQAADARQIAVGLIGRG